jgi:hypothetical protein
MVLGNSPKTSNSEDESEGIHPPEFNDGSAVQVVTGEGIELIQDKEAEPNWPTAEEQAAKLANLMTIRRKENEMDTMILDWMSKADRFMLCVDGKEAVQWEMFYDKVWFSDDRDFAVLEHRRF